MKKTILVLAVTLIFAMVVQPAWAQDDEMELEVSVDAAFMSKYVWRGLVLTDGFTFQPGLTIGAGGFSVNVWANMDLDDVNDNEFEFNEVDFTGDYSFDLEMLSISAGLIYYTFPNTDFDSTLEFYLGATLNTILSPSVTWYQDVDLVEGTYINFGVSHDLPLEGSDIALSLFANAGWGSEDHNLFYYGAAEAAFTDFMAGASVSIPLCERLTIAPMVAYSNLIDSAISDMFEEPDTFIFGVSGSLGF